MFAAPTPGGSSAWPPHFTQDELQVSQMAERMGLDNSCPAHLLPRLRETAWRMENIRKFIFPAHPIIVLSGYRTAAVNSAVGGAPNSAHKDAFAIDFRVPSYGNPWAVIQQLLAHKEVLGPFDQIIHEYRQWVHIGFGPGSRRQLLSKFKGRPYEPGILK